MMEENLCRLYLYCTTALVVMYVLCNLVILYCTAEFQTLQQYYIHSYIIHILYILAEEEFTSLGTEFYVAFPNNLELPPLLSSANLRLGIATDEIGSVSIMVTSESGTKEISTVGNSTEVELDKSLKLTSFLERDKGVHIQTDGRGVSVVALSEEDTSADLFLVLPPVYIPDRYVYYAISVERNGTQANYHSAILIVATENETLVNFTLTVRANESNVAGSGFAGQPMSVILNEMDTLYIKSLENLAGSKAVSNKPITFISGHECGNIPRGRSFCDHMFEQIPPVATWGKEFFTVPLKSRHGFDIIMLVASEDNTSVTCVCNPPSETSKFEIAAAGDIMSLNVSSEQYCSIFSNKPVMLVQFAVAADIDGADADPFMMLIPPLEQYRKEYIISTFEPQNLRNVSYFINIVVKTSNISDLSQFLLNGLPVGGSWSDIFCENDLTPCAYGMQLDIDISHSSHLLFHENSDMVFGATVYSFGLRVGQGYAAAFDQRPVACKFVPHVCICNSSMLFSLQWIQ